MTYEEFIDKIHDPERKYNYYFAEQNVPESLLADLVQPKLGSDLLNLHEIAIWHGIGTVSLPHTDDDENFMCVVSR